MQKRARKTFIEVLKHTEITGWGAASVFYREISEKTAKVAIHNYGVWRREGHEIWLQRRTPRGGLGKPETVLTATLKPSFPGMVQVSRKVLASEIETFLKARGTKAAAQINKSFAVQAIPESAFRELFDADLWKVVNKLASLEDPLHQFYLSWKDKRLVISLEGELEDAESTRMFLVMSFRIINRLIALGAGFDKPTVPAFTRDILTIKPEMSVFEAAELMKTNNLGLLIVSEDKTVPLGIFTERDLCRRVVALKLPPAETPVWKVMSQKFVAIKSTDPMEKAYSILSKGQFRHVPVFDGKKVTGMVSLTDLFKRLYQRWEESLEDGKSSLNLNCDVFTREVVSVSPEATIADAAGEMKKHNIGSVLVMENGGDRKGLLGILTERDICRKVVSAKVDPQKTSVSKVATSAVVAIDVADPLDRAFTILGKADFRHLPVRARGKVVGVFSIADMVKHLQQTLSAAK